MSLIENYARRQLSYPSDRLPAIQGVVAEYPKRLSDNYTAGNLQGDLFRSLAWIPDHGLSAPPDYLSAPS
jgi:hypothetical protein